MTKKTLAATNTAEKKSRGERRQKRASGNSGQSVCPHSVCVCLLHPLCSGKKLRILLTSLGPDSCRWRHIEWSSSLYLGLFFSEGWVTPNCVFGSMDSKSLCWVTLFHCCSLPPSIQPIESHGNKTSFTHCPFLHILPLHFLFAVVVVVVLIPLVLTSVETNKDRKSQTLNWASRRVGGLVCVCVCKRTRTHPVQMW